MYDPERLIDRLDALIDRLERLLPEPPAASDWAAPAFRWRTRNGRGWLHAVCSPQRLDPADLLCLERQQAEIERNTRQFLAGRGANNLLLWGSRGTGKSSLIKAIFNAYRDQGLRLIEVDKEDLRDLPDILDLIRERPERFILFCDDLSFEAGEPGYKALKAALEGSISATPDNLLIYATSNRRHLMPGVPGREPRGPSDRWRDAPGRVRGGKDLTLGPLRSLDQLSPLHPGPVSGHGPPLVQPPGVTPDGLGAGGTGRPAMGPAPRLPQRPHRLAVRPGLGGAGGRDGRRIS